MTDSLDIEMACERDCLRVKHTHANSIVKIDFVSVDMAYFNLTQDVEISAHYSQLFCFIIPNSLRSGQHT